MPNLYGDIPTHLETVRGGDQEEKKKKKPLYIEAAETAFPRLGGILDTGGGKPVNQSGGGLLPVGVKALMKLL